MGLNSASERLVRMWNNNIHIVRAAFAIAAWMLLMASLALPALERVIPMMGKAVHYEYLFFSYRYWREGEVKEDSRKKTLVSIALVSFSCAFLSAGILLAMARYTRTLIAANVMVMAMLVFSVINMYMGMYHFNLSAGADHVGQLAWGPCQTIHIVAAGCLVVPTAFLIFEFRNERKGVAVCTSTFSQTSRRALLAVPLLVAAVLTVGGAGSPQALNHFNPNYVTAWHYDMMSFDFDLEYMKDTFCTAFFNKLAAGAGCGVIACSVAFFGVLLTVFVPRKPLVAAVVNTVALCFTICTVSFVGSLITVVECEAPRKTQPQLRFSHGFICLLISMGIHFVGVFVSFLSLKLDVVEKDVVGADAERIFLNTEEINNYSA